MAAPAQKKAFALRLDPAVHAAIERLAGLNYAPRMRRSRCCCAKH